MVISTRNNAVRLDQTLGGLGRLRLPEATSLEIIVVDNGSSDDTATTLGAWERRLPLRWLRVEQPGVATAKNAGVAAARGDLLLCTDDDVDVPQHWLAAYAAAYRLHGDRCFYGGPIVPRYEGPEPDPALRQFTPVSVRGMDLGRESRPLRGGEYFIGPNWACPASRFRQAGGYDPRLGYNATGGPSGGGEETDLMARLRASGVHAWYIPEATLEHWVPVAKASPAHIYRCHEAFATVSAWLEPGRIPGPRVGRVPVRLLAQLGRAAAWYGASLVGLGQRDLAYGELRWKIGLVKGYRLPPRHPGEVERGPHKGTALAQLLLLGNHWLSL